MNTDPHRIDPEPPEPAASEPALPVGEEAANHGVRAAVDAYIKASSADVSEAPEEAVPESAPPAEPPLPSQEELAAALTEVRSVADENRDQLLRARAELENIRRRHANELEKAHKYALDSFVRELLQVRDSLELGHSAALEETVNIEKLREGTELTLKLLGDVMDKFGVAPVEPLEQPFDPEFHQAISTQPRADLPPNTVVAVIQKGYTLNGRLVRPALVLVSQQVA
ncbi:nucleotide exchange factor GrpE [Thiocystis violascens]|uniref:Protein GrpE n=1 Tax=Thiocystis violascens (strain ATCC 17096 / DSM 198 / 6111) TaxID=765911 RepID=I3YHC0_THIV6|nr:nucleotide exchange factor GrpE [Thiocystis violascens]AFL76388.1 molecular chaperone GrpE (heat shock protein) [Thiocystis violascens DSM 198]